MDKPAKLASVKPAIEIKKIEIEIAIEIKKRDHYFMMICCPKATQKQFLLGYL